MSTVRSSDPISDDEYEMRYGALTLSNRLFGAFFEAVECRIEEGSLLNQKAFADKMCKTESSASKLLSGPGNWRLDTIARFMHALDLDFDFAFVDRKDNNRIFTDTGKRTRDWETEKSLRTDISYNDYNSNSFINPQTKELRNNTFDVLYMDEFKKPVQNRSIVQDMQSLATNTNRKRA